MNEYTIKPKESFPEKIGELIWMLEHVREVTLQEVETLTKSELDFLPSDGANSIGSLLAHIASIEFVHQVISFENKDLTKEEYSKWGDALELGDQAKARFVKHPLDYYL
uniref:DinB family protein n=1 Tax=Enterococcus faecium TaxID=1352 RepID=UPI0030C8C128